MNATTAVFLLAVPFLSAAALASDEPPGPAAPGGVAAEADCAIVLGPDLFGHFAVHDLRGTLVADLYKPAGRTVELGLEPGRYDVVYDQEPVHLAATVRLESRQRQTLDRASFGPVERIETKEHHADKPERPAELLMKGRTRVELFGGFTDSHVEVDHHESHVHVDGGQGGLAFAHWLREDLALDLQFLATDVEVVDVDHGPFDSSETRGSMGFLLGARYYFPKATFGGAFRPYLAGAVGPFSEYDVFDGEHWSEVHTGHTHVGGQVGGGVDFQLRRLFSLGVRMGVTFRDGHDPSFGTTFGFGFAWGKGRM